MKEGFFYPIGFTKEDSFFLHTFAIKIKQKSQNLLSRTVRAPRGDAGMEKRYRLVGVPSKA